MIVLSRADPGPKSSSTALENSEKQLRAQPAETNSCPPIYMITTLLNTTWRSFALEIEVHGKRT
jgi:hypothetical protein